MVSPARRTYVGCWARGSSFTRTGPGTPCDSAGNASACRPGRAAIARAIRTPDRRIGARPPREPAAGRPGSAAGLRQRAVSARLAELLLVAVLPSSSEAGWRGKVLARRAACHPAAVLPCAPASGRRRRLVSALRLEEGPSPTPEQAPSDSIHRRRWCPCFRRDRRRSRLFHIRPTARP